MRSKIAFHEVSYELLRTAEAHAPHEPAEMVSATSRGPIRMWVCIYPKCNEIVYTYTSHSTPACRGGAEWSFTTSLGHIKGLHKEGIK